MIYIFILIDLLIFAALDYIFEDKAEIGKDGIVLKRGNSKFTYFKNIFFVINLIILIIVAGFRYFSGLDYMSYAYMVYKVQNHIPIAVEKGYYYLNVLIYTFTDQVQVIFLVMAILITSVKGFVINKFIDKKNFTLFIIFCLYFLIGDMGQIRSTFAQSLDFLAIFLFIKNRKKTSFLVILLGVFFHLSSAIMFVMFIFRDRKFKTKTLIVIYILAAIFGQIIDLNLIADFAKHMGGFAGNKIFKYANSKSIVRVGISFNVLFDFATLLFLLFMRKYYKIKNTTFNIAFNLYYLGILSYLIFNNYFVVAARFANYFRLGLVILIPMMISKIKSKKIRWIVISIFILIFSMMVLRQLHGHWNEYVPYKINLFKYNPN